MKIGLEKFCMFTKFFYKLYKKVWEQWYEFLHVLNGRWLLSKREQSNEM